MTPPQNLGLDPRTVLSRWCELECTSFTELSCNGNSTPSAEEISRHSHHNFTAGSSRHPACVTACNAALPDLLTQTYPIHRYFVENHGVEIGRKLQRQDPEGHRCGPPPPGSPRLQEISQPLPEPSPQPLMSRNFFTDPSPSPWPLTAALALGVAVMVLAPEFGVLALL